MPIWPSLTRRSTKALGLAALALLLGVAPAWAQVIGGGGVVPGSRFTGGVITRPLQLPDGTAALPSLTFSGDTDTGLYRIGANELGLVIGGALALDLDNASGSRMRWYIANDLAGNYDGFRFSWNAGANVLNVGTFKNGTGLARAIEIEVGGVSYWNLPTTGHLLAHTDNTVDIGASGATRPRTIYAGTSLVSPAYYNGTGAGVLTISSTAPTISSGFGSSPSIAANNGSAAFTVNVGTGGAASAGVVGLPTATTGWRVSCDDVTTKSATVFVTRQTATSTTTATIGNFNTAGAAAAWVASDVLVCSATAY